MKVTIADSLFLPHSRAAKMGRENADVGPQHFEWVLSDPATARFVTDSDIKHVRGPGQVALLLESFFLHPENYLEATRRPFDAVLTHNAYFAANFGWLLYPPGGSFIRLEKWKVYPKQYNTSILLSPKQTMPGHKLIHAVAEKYKSRVDGIFGLHSFADKLDAIAPYRFTVVVEGERIDSFFTEKLIDCMAVGTIPIYWGCPNIGDYFDPRGILQADGLDEIGDHLTRVSEEMYQSRIISVGNNMQTAIQYRILEDWIYRRYPVLFEEWK